MRKALVTGANRGIGRAIARMLAERTDIEVIAAARQRSAGEELVAELGTGTAIELDLQDLAATETRAQEIDETFGGIDILVNNAGVLFSGSALEVRRDALETSMAVNALAPLLLSQRFGTGMKRRGAGRIVNLSSGWGSFAEGLTGPAAYSISKAALNAVTVSLAQALGPAVQVNAVCPGWVRTDMGGAGATRSPEEGADTAVWLATATELTETGGFFRDRRPIAW